MTHFIGAWGQKRRGYRGKDDDRTGIMLIVLRRCSTRLLVYFLPGGIPAYQSYPWGNVYGQTGIHQHVQCPPIFPPSLGGAREHQPSSSASLSSYFTLGEHGPSHANPQRSSHTLTHTTSISSGSGSSTAAVLPPVSTLRPSRLRAEITPTKAASLLPSQVTPASPDSPTVTPCVKIEYDSPQEIHSHFHCDFSSIHFWLCACQIIL